MRHVDATIRFSGCLLDVTGVYTPGYDPSEFDPGEPALFEISSVTWNNLDITQLVFAIDREEGKTLGEPLGKLRWQGSLATALEQEALNQGPFNIEPDPGPDTDGFGF